MMANSSLAPKNFHEFNLNVEVALGLLAMHGLDVAIERLYEEFGIDTTTDKLDRCRRAFPEKYQEIQEQLAPQIEAKAVTDARANIARANAPIALAVERAHQALADGRVGDPAKIAEQLANVQGKQTDTMMKLQGRPVVTKEVHTIQQIEAELEAISPDIIVKAEIVDAPPGE